MKRPRGATSLFDLLTLLVCAIALSVWASCGDEELGGSRTLAIDRVSPSQAQQGEQIRLMGVGFGDVRPERAAAWVGGVCTAITGWSDTAVTLVVPAGAGLGERLVVVSADGRKSAPAVLSIVGEDRPADVVYCDESIGR